MRANLKRVLLDFERMAFPFTGFYYCNLHFGNVVLEIAPPDMQFSFYLNEKQFGMFGTNALYESNKSYFRPEKNRFLKFLRRVFRKDASRQYDIIHISDQHSHFVPRDKSAKVLLTVHDLNYLLENQDQKTIAEENRKHQRMIDMADHIVCISNYSRECVLANLDVGNKPVDVIYQGCQIAELKETVDPVYKPHRPFLFALSNLLPKKNFHVLPCLLKNNNYELVISGIHNHTLQREYVKVIQKEARKHGVADRVTITGPISDNDRQWYYKNCLAFMFPSLAEGFGIPPLEAMYFGKPVFASTFTSVPEICGDAAYYFTSFEPENMIRTFKEGMHHYETFKPIQKLKDRYNFFSWDKTVRQYIKVYEKL